MKSCPPAFPKGLLLFVLPCLALSSSHDTRLVAGPAWQGNAPGGAAQTALRQVQGIETVPTGSPATVTGFEEGRQKGLIRALELTAGDFDGDGTQDLVIGWGGNPGAGYITLLKGSLEAVLPHGAGQASPDVASKALPFRPEMLVYGIPASPRFLASGDFDGDGLSDLVFAEGESETVWFLHTEDAGFGPPRPKALPGIITALAPGEVNRPDGLTDLVVALDSVGSPAIAVLESPRGLRDSDPEIIPVDAPAARMLVRDLDQDGLSDIAAASVNSVSVIWGRDRLLSFTEERRASVGEPLADQGWYSQKVLAVAVGDFVSGPDLELVVLLADGELEVNHCRRGFGLEPVLSVASGLNRAVSGLSQLVDYPADLVGHVLRTARVSSHPQDALIGLSSSMGSMAVLSLDDEARISQLPFPPTAALPAMVLPLRLNQDAFDDLVVVSAISGEISLILTQEDAAFTVNADGNDSDYSQGDGICDTDNSPEVQECTLRAAIQEGNAGSADSYRISFSIDRLEGISSLPDITKPVTLSGGNVILDGTSSSAAPSLRFLGGSSVLQGIRAIGFGNLTFAGANNRIEGNWLGTIDGTTKVGTRGGVVLQDASSSIVGGTAALGNLIVGVSFVESIQFWGSDNRDNTIQGNYIGTDAAGLGGQGTYGGIRIREAANTLIGGAGSRGNIITNAESGSGIHASHVSGLLIQGNRVGTDTTGQAGFENASYGIWVEQDSEAITIGGTTSELGNMVVASRRHGILISDSSSVLVQGNLVGTNAEGSSGLGNGRRGIWLLRESTSDPARPSAVGGVSEGAGNVISGNGWNGLGIGEYDNVEVIGNKIGTDISGSSPIPNQLGGLGFGSNDRGLIKANVIAFNGGDGVQVDWGTDGGTGNRITENSIFFNGGLGINLCPCDEDDVPAVTPNDEGDGDTGANQLQNFPVLSVVPGSSGITGTLNSRPGTTYRLEFFSGDSCDESGHGEGQEYLGSLSVSVDASGNGTFDYPGATAGKAITATATDPDGNTSEFSACATAPQKTAYVVNTTGDDPDQNADTGSYDGICSTGRKADGSNGACNPQTEGDCECTLRAAIQEANHRQGKDEIHFNIEGSSGQSENAVQRIRPGSPLPDITDEVFINGYTQPGSREASASTPALLKIELDGTNAGQDSDGLVLSTSDSEVRGLAIHSFGRHGIVLEGSDNQVAGNYLGVDPTGSEIRQPESSLSQSGVWVFNAPENLIGGEDFRDRNLIAGFTIGLQIFGPGASGNEVYGNLFCTDAAGETLLTDKMCSATGINLLQASGNVIGGKKPNIIGGTGIGISIAEGEGTVGNRIQGNLIGTNAADPQSGTDFGNWVGIAVKANDNLIGGAGPGEGNTLAFGAHFQPPPQLEGHYRVGILLNGKARGNHVQGNLIHAYPDFGVLVTEEASDNVIGGPDGTFGNTITENRLGVVINSELSMGNSILSNRIFGNGGLGISLNSGVPLENDRNDGDAGPNESQNNPVFPRYMVHVDARPHVTVDPQGVTIRARLDSLPNEDFEIQFFAAHENEFNAYCQGERYLGKRTVTSNFVGNAYVHFRIPLSHPGLQGANLVTATATDSSGSTSEFSRCALFAPDSDGDGIPDGIEEGTAGGDSNQNGIPDSTERDVAVFRPWYDDGGRFSGSISVDTTAAEIVLDTFFSPATALESYIVVSLKDRMPLGWAESRQQLSATTTGSFETIRTVGRQPEQAGSCILTYLLPGGVRVSGFYNFGPTPDNPVDHLYEFLFDGTTGAHIFDDRIEVHFVDGARGDHDLSVNGVIQTLGGPVINSTTFYFAQLGDGLAGSIQFQSSMVFGNAGGISPVQVDLADSAGQFLDLDFGELGSGSLFEFGLTPGEALSVQTPGVDSLKVGYAEIIGAEGLGGTAIFSRSDAGQGILLYETGVPAARTRSDFSLFVDSLGNRDTGLALAYPRLTGQQQADASVTLRLYDKSFQPIGTRDLTLSPGEHLARFIHELFPGQAARASEMEGVVTVESDQAIAAVTLRQNDDPGREFPDEVPTLTAFPVIPGRADGDTSATSEERTFYFAQVADGAVPGIALRTSMIFVNTGGDSQLRIELYDSSGGPMALDLGPGQISSVFEVALSRGEAVSLQSPGTGNLKVGYAKISAGIRVGGTAVFTLIHTPTGTLLYEAGVPASERLSDFSLVVDSSGDRRTGVALVNPTAESGSESASLTLRLYDQGFNLLEEKQLELAAGEHYARFINEIFPDVEGVTEMLGSLTVHSDRPVAAVTLRETNDPGKDFPNEVPTLSTFPVIPGRGDE